MTAAATLDANAPFMRTAGRSLLAGAIVAVVGLVFLGLMYASFATGVQAGGERFGTINDILVVIQYVLMIPAVVAVYVLGRDRWRMRSLAIAASGVVLVALIVLLQGLLIGGAMTFDEQIGPLSVMLALLAAWFVAIGWQVTALGVASRGILLGLLAATYLGFPIWAIWLGRALRDSALTEHAPGTADLPAA